ncbi:MAG: hypothetical protein IGBAC_0316 [Ignavibacteriae bacterium]|nr:MAG: hypothetical protein IGBAC_0316 [Ignavibacteriota bacterium]
MIYTSIKIFGLGTIDFINPQCSDNSSDEPSFGYLLATFFIGALLLLNM